MTFLQRLRAWWDARKQLPIDKLLAVDFDDDLVRVSVLARLDVDWEQSFRWVDVERVCFTDGGIYRSDALFIHVRERSKPVVVLTEARGGPAFFGALCARGLFPPHVMQAAVRETGGRTHCWP